MPTSKCIAFDALARLWNVYSAFSGGQSSADKATTEFAAQSPFSGVFVTLWYLLATRAIGLPDWLPIYLGKIVTAVAVLIAL